MSQDTDRHCPEDRCTRVGQCRRQSRGTPPFRRVIERNAALWYAGSLCATFLAGFSTYHYMEEASGIEPVPKVEHSREERTIAALREELDKVTAHLNSLLDALTKLKGAAPGVLCPGAPVVPRSRRQKEPVGTTGSDDVAPVESGVDEMSSRRRAGSAGGNAPEPAG
jgi:hypothetical protein